MRYKLTVDSGGTFTDVVSIDETGKTVMTKTHTTPDDVTIGTLNAIEKMAGLLGMTTEELLGNTNLIVHGTTQATNIVATKKGAKIGGIFNKGYRDRLTFLHVAKSDMSGKLKESTSRMYDFDMDFPDQLAERQYMLDVEERLLPDGSVQDELNEDQVRELACFFKKEGIEAIAICFMYSYLNPAHELRAAEIVKEEYPEVQISMSHKVIPIQGEVRRWSTTMFDAYVAPKMRAYVDRIQEKLANAGFKGSLVFMQSNGGVASPETIKEIPCKLLVSGPAAGPSTAVALGKPHGIDNIISVDMGGTSFDMAIIPEGEIRVVNELLVDDKKFCLTTVEVNAIGAGGGSIASVNWDGRLTVGPDSAGGAPGPACYGLGGTAATVTDADVVLGYIDPDYFLGGESKLYKELAEKAIKENVADPLGISVPEAAASIYDVINNKMSSSLELVFSRKGHDPRDFMIIGAGGASAVHVAKIAQDMGIKGFMIPKMAPVYCAYGMLYTDLKHDFIKPYFSLFSNFNFDEANAIFDEMEEKAVALLKRDGAVEDEIVVHKYFDMKYYGETKDMRVELPQGKVTQESLDEVAADFHTLHEKIIGNSNPGYPLQTVCVSLAASYTPPAPLPLKAEKGGKDASHAIKKQRQAWFDGGYKEVNIYDGEKMMAGNRVEGPCIIEEKMTTVVVPTGFTIEMDDFGNYIKV